MKPAQCQICGKDFNNKRKRFEDICPDTQFTRGFLCKKCILGLKYFKYPYLLNNALIYLDKAENHILNKCAKCL